MSNQSNFTCDICKFTKSSNPQVDKWYKALQTPTLFTYFLWKSDFSVAEQQCISGIMGNGTFYDICTQPCLLRALNNFQMSITGGVAFAVTLPPLPGTQG